MLTDTSFRSLHRFKNSRSELDRAYSARSIGYYVPKEQRQEQLRDLRTASFNLGHDRPSYLSTHQELAGARSARGALDQQAANRACSARSGQATPTQKQGEAAALQAKMARQNWRLAHIGAGDRTPEPKTTHRRFHDDKHEASKAGTVDRQRWQENLDYLRRSHIDLSVRQFDKTYTTAHRELEEFRGKKVDPNRPRLEASSSLGSVRSGTSPDRKVSNVCLGLDKKYHGYGGALTAFQDGFRAPGPPRGRSQLASIKEKDLERQESGKTLDQLTEAGGVGEGKSPRAVRDDDDRFSTSSREYGAFAVKRMAQTTSNFKFGCTDDLTAHHRFNDAKKKDPMPGNFDKIKSTFGQSKAVPTDQDSARGKSHLGDNSARGGAHDKTFDIFAGGRSTGARDRDYNSMQKLTQTTSLAAQHRHDYAIAQAAYTHLKDKFATSNLAFESDGVRPRNAADLDLRRREAMALRLGLTEQMEKYINHDLGLIQEEQEQRTMHREKNKALKNVDLSTQRGKLIGSSTTYRDNHYQKSGQTPELRQLYVRARDYARQSSLQRQTAAPEQRSMQLKAPRGADKDGTINPEDEEKSRGNEAQSAFTTEARQNFSKANLARAYGVLGQAQRQEMQAIVARGKSQNFNVMRQTNQGAIVDREAADAGPSCGWSARELPAADPSQLSGFLATSRRLVPNPLNRAVRGSVHPASITPNPQAYKMPNINTPILQAFKGEQEGRFQPRKITRIGSIAEANYTPAGAYRAAPSGFHRALERTGGPRESRPRLELSGAITHLEARRARADSTLVAGREDLLAGPGTERRGGPMARTGASGRYSSLRGALEQARALRPGQQSDMQGHMQPRSLRHAFESLKATQQAPVQLARAKKIYTDTRLLRRLFQKEGEGQASLAREPPFLTQAARARSTIAGSPREEPDSSPPRRDQGNSQFKTSNQSFMTWIQPLPREKERSPLGRAR